MLACVMVGVLLVRRLRDLRPWGVLDALLALALMLWLSSSTVLAAEALRMGPDILTGDGMAGITPSLESALLGTTVGTVAAGAFALLRARSGGGLALLGITRPRGWAWAAAVAGLPLFLAISWLWGWLLESQGMVVEQQAIVEEILAAPGSPTALLALVYGVVAAPVLEELLFRGFLLVPVARWTGRALAVSVTAALFALMHLADPTSVVPLFVLGQLLGWLRVWSGSLGPPMLLHALNNGFAFAVALSLS